MVTALVTGGTGFVGSHVARALINAGHNVRILRRDSSPLTLIADLPVEHALGDVTDADSLASALIGCEWVFHVAAVSDYWRADKTLLYKVNVEGTRLVLDAAQQAGVKRIVFTSSAAAIGRRADGQPADESVAFTTNPARFPYAHSKVLAEREVQRAVERGQDVVIVNPSVVMGPGDLNQISGSILVELARGGIPALPPGSITLIDVRDVAAAHLTAALVGQSGERYILGAIDISWKALAELAAPILGVKTPRWVIPAFMGEPLAWVISALRVVGIRLPIDATQIRESTQNLLFDCHKSWRVLGKPQIDLQHTLQDTVDWYIAHGDIQPRR